MNAVNPVQLLILVWTFTAVCQADNDVICEDVTGTVGEEVTLTCSVSQSLECTSRCIKGYKFQSPTTYDASKICKLSADPCEQRNSFTCRFTPTTAKTGQFGFFVQTQCGRKTTKFTVNITERSKHEPDTEAPETTATEAGPRSVIGDRTGSKNTVIAAVVGCFFIIIIILITLKILYKTKSSQPQWIQGFLCRRHDEDNSNCPEDMI